MQVILSHENTDFDALAAMLGAWKLHPGALPVLPRRLNRNVRDFLTLYWDVLPFIHSDDLPRRPVTRLIVVDTQTYSPVKGINARTEIEIIDHHPLSRPAEPKVAVHVDRVGATTTLLTERISSTPMTLTPAQATLLLLGIYEDTGSLSYLTTTARDVRAAAWLFEQGADLVRVNDFLHHPISEGQRELYNKLIQDAEPYQFAGHAVIVATAQAGEQVEEISTLAHKLRDLYDPAALFVLVQMNGQIQLVARSTTDAIDVSQIAEAFHGGGHGKAAAALIRDMTLRETHDRLIDLLERHVRPSVIVSEIMSQGVHTLESTASVADAAALMSRLGHEGFPVVEGGEVVGILTRREIDRAMQLRLGSAPVSLYMTPGKIEVGPESSVEQLQQIMVDFGVGQVPVVKDGRPMGIVTRTDLIRLWSTPQRRPPRAVDMAARLSACLPAGLEEVLRHTGELADELGYALYVVGGFVRDLLLDIPNLDLDLVVEGDAIQLARRLARRVGGRVRSHSRFGTAKWLPEEVSDELADLPALDFVTARTEFYEHPTALPQVERSSIRQDLHRRDFTINTLAICLNRGRYGELLDFFGGEMDLRRGLIRVLHSLSFVEDPTRILRAVRLEQRLGFRLEARTEELIGSALDLLGHTGAERIRHELYLVLAEAEPERALRRLTELNVLQQMQPSLRATDWLMERAQALRQELKRWREPAGPEAEPPAFRVADYRMEGLYLALLTYRLSEEDLEAFLLRWRILREEVRLCRQVCDLRGLLVGLAADRLRRSEIYNILEPYDEQTLFAVYVASDIWLVRQRIELYLRRLRNVRPRTDGHCLKALGLPSGPAYRAIIEALRAGWLDGEIQDAVGEEALLRRLLDAAQAPAAPTAEPAE